MIALISGKLQSFVTASVLAMNGDGLYFDGQLDPDSIKPLAAFGILADYGYLSKRGVRYYSSRVRSICLSGLTGGDYQQRTPPGFWMPAVEAPA